MEGKLEKEVRFDADWIERYCNLVGDTNRIHTKEYMRKRMKPGKDGQMHGSQVITPGLVVVCAYGDMLEESFKRGANCLDVHFGGFLCEEDRAKLVVSPFEDGKGSRISVYNGDGSDIFCSRGNNSVLCKRELQEVNFGENHRQVNVPLLFDERDKFGELMGIENKGIRDTFLCLSLISSTLFSCVKYPESEIEKELSRKYDEGNLPVYTKVCAHFPSRSELLLHPGEPLNFEVVSSKGSGKRDYSFSVDCKQGDFPIYDAEMNVILMPEEVLVRGARMSTMANGAGSTN